MSATQSGSTHAMACTHCREKKLRCGRERPQCANCKRDGMDCGYSVPQKRVNHIKLLCDSVGGVIDRLSKVEGELSHLNIMLKTRPCQSPFGEESSAQSPADGRPSEDMLLRNQTDRYTVRSEGDLIDRYHGPCSLVALCNEFRDLVLLEQRKRDLPRPDDESQNSQKRQRMANNDEAVQGLLTRLCLEAGLEEPFDHQSDHMPIRLPPKQFLLMAHTEFFQRSDYTTDLFVHSSFLSNVEQIYSRPFKPSDEAWAVCFNTIILLALGSENSTQHDNDPIAGSQFAVPFLLAVRTALNNPRVLMAPRLINVQALALLSIASQQYYPTGLSESIFAQACMLARTMGLHHTCIIPEGVSAEEAEERLRVFISLYLQDKSFSISRGSLCWLPSFDCTLPSELSQIGLADPTCVARLELAQLQEDIYQSFCSAESRTHPPAKREIALSRIERRLRHWAHKNEVFALSLATTRNVDLYLDFLAATIIAFRVSSNPGHAWQALDSARASCILLLRAYGQHNPPMLERLETLLLPYSPSRIYSKTASPQSGGSDKGPSSETATPNTDESITQRSYGLLYTSSILAIFTLTKGIVSTGSTNTESQAGEDLDLLKRVCTCFQELNTRSQSHDTVKIGRVLQGVFEVVSLTTRPPNPAMSLYRCNPTTSPSSQDSQDSGQSAPGFCSPPALSPYKTLSLLQNTSSTWASTRTCASPNLTAPLDSQHTAQTLEPLRQHLLSTCIQHQSMPPRSRKRPHENDQDLSADSNSELTSLSDFLFVGPDMSFDVIP